MFTFMIVALLSALVGYFIGRLDGYSSAWDSLDREVPDTDINITVEVDQESAQEEKEVVAAPKKKKVAKKAKSAKVAKVAKKVQKSKK